MGLLASASWLLPDTSVGFCVGLVALFLASAFVLLVVANALRQLVSKNPNEPPVVFHWIPFLGSTITYGIEPYRFFFNCREKYGDIFTFVLLGKKMTVYLGTKGNEFILNGKLKDVCAEEVYNALCLPIFGRDVVYDCPNSKLMEQKKFVKFGLTADALRSYVTLIAKETEAFVASHPDFRGQSGVFDVTSALAQLTIFTASRSLQGEEVREKFDSSFAELFHDLDAGFSPINFMLPWAPLPHNKRRDIAQEKITRVYLDIIRNRRESGSKRDSEDMIWNLMQCSYKDGRAVPDHEIAHIMIALLMAGQHSSSSTISWMVLNLTANPQVQEDLLEEQRRQLGQDLPPVTHDSLQLLHLNARVVRETLRIHAPIHSIMRAVKSPMPVDGTPYVIPTSHRLLAAPGVTSRMDAHFADPERWDPYRWDERGEATKVGAAAVAGKEADDTAAAAAAAAAEAEKVDYGYGLVTKGTGSPYLPFGAGRHRCIGEQFAYLQLGVILAYLNRHFKFSAVPGSKPLVDTDYSSLFSRPKAPARIRWERREKVGVPN